MPSFISSVLDLVYPPHCYSCGEKLSGHGLFFICGGCLKKVRYIRGTVCPVCGRPGTAAVCGRCLGADYSFSMARSACLYEGVVSVGVRNFKYGRRLHLAKTMGRLLTEGLRTFPEAGKADLVVPVPLSGRKRRERGFNQSEFLAREAGRYLGKHLIRGNLVKTRDSPAQVGLSGRAREENVRGAFGVKVPRVFESARILLVDDVYTTGSTAEECARVLKLAGASDVRVLTLALRL